MSTTDNTNKNEPIPAPAWLEAWTKPRENANALVYNVAQVAHMRMSARQDPQMRDVMLAYPPRCVIAFRMNGKDTYGIVTGVCTVALDNPPKGHPKHVVTLRFVPSPLHVSGAISESEREPEYVMPDGVQVLGYSPEFTPDTMRALLVPAGLA